MWYLIFIKLILSSKLVLQWLLNRIYESGKTIDILCALKRIGCSLCRQPLFYLWASTDISRYFLFYRQGTVELYKTDPSATPLPYWSNTYIRTLSRLKNLANSDYWVALGIKAFLFRFNQDSASNYRQYCSATILSPTTFNIFAYVDHEYYFVSWKINYLAGSYKIPNIYF